MNRVFLYGCRPPIEHDRAMQLLGQASNYVEELRGIYNRHKQRTRELLARERPSFSDDDAHVYAWRRTHVRDHAHVLAFFHRELLDRVNQAREARGHLVDAGTYWLVEKAARVAHKDSGLDPIKRRDWDGTGRIGAAIQAVQKFPADDWRHSRVQLLMPDVAEQATRSKRSRNNGTLTITVGTAKRGASITWPIKLDRPLPKGAMVKQVAVQRRRDGHRYRWEALITVEYEHHELRDANAQGVVGVDIGWRSEGKVLEPYRHEPSWQRSRAKRNLPAKTGSYEVEEMRIATHDSELDDGALLVNTYGLYRYADDVLSTRDQEYNVALASAVTRGLAAHPQWKRKERLHRLARITGDEALLAWSLRDKHLEDIAVGVRKRGMRRRLDACRVYADTLAKRYQYIALEDMPMSTWVGRGDTSDLERRRSAAALYVLQMTLADRFGPHRTDWVPAAYTTMTCACCNVIRSEPVGAAAYWTCACGAVHHQDYNAAEIIRRASERWLADKNPPRARKKKSQRKEEKTECVEIEESSQDDTARESLLEAAE